MALICVFHIAHKHCPVLVNWSRVCVCSCALADLPIASVYTYTMPITNPSTPQSSNSRRAQTDIQQPSSSVRTNNSTLLSRRENVFNEPPVRRANEEAREQMTQSGWGPGSIPATGIAHYYLQNASANPSQLQQQRLGSHRSSQFSPSQVPPSSAYSLGHNGQPSSSQQHLHPNPPTASNPEVSSSQPNTEPNGPWIFQGQRNSPSSDRTHPAQSQSEVTANSRTPAPSYSQAPVAAQRKRHQPANTDLPTLAEHSNQGIRPGHDHSASPSAGQQRLPKESLRNPTPGGRFAPTSSSDQYGSLPSDGSILSSAMSTSASDWSSSDAETSMAPSEASLSEGGVTVISQPPAELQSSMDSSASSLSIRMAPSELSEFSDGTSQG